MSTRESIASPLSAIEIADATSIDGRGRAARRDEGERVDSTLREYRAWPAR